MDRRQFLSTAAMGVGALAASQAFGQPEQKKPNVLWIVAEDASPHIGCYGERAVQTPNLDALAKEGVRFEKAFVTAPVCSPARSALMTGMYQTSIGSHNHRSQSDDRKAGGNTEYYASYQLPAEIPLIEDVFREGGYYVANGQHPSEGKPGKTDYNFLTKEELYDGADWTEAPDGKPFFAQIQLSGGKWRKGRINHDNFTIPPYYPDDPVVHEDWAEYLGSWEKVDREVGEIVDALKAAGQYENTLIFFITDHGISHARGKQFLYDEGIQIPMIVRFPDGRLAGSTRDDLVLHIDMGPTSLAFAGLAVPGHLEGHDLFAAELADRDFVVSARDRCDETIDVIRSVRTARYKYIRNFLSYRPHMQRSQYKDGKEMIQRMRELHALEALTPLQDSLFAPTRPAEELYDLDADPFETTNLAGDPAHGDILKEQRKRLHAWMIETHDPGLIPEPILEDLGKDAGSKYAAMRKPGMDGVVRRIIATIKAGEGNDRAILVAALGDADPSVRYWAATWLGHLRAMEHTAVVAKRTQDDVPAVRVAAHLALCKMGLLDAHLPGLVALVDEPNLLVGLYAMNGVEQIGVVNAVTREAAAKAIANPYDGTQRYGLRLQEKCGRVEPSGAA